MHLAPTGAPCIRGAPVPPYRTVVESAVVRRKLVSNERAGWLTVRSFPCGSPGKKAKIARKQEPHEDIPPGSFPQEQLDDHDG
jgi:hypothetical protein